MSTQPATIADSATDLVEGLARAARSAQRQLARMDSPVKERALTLAAAALRAAEAEILAANAQDMANGAANGLSSAMLDRLKLTPERLAGIADAVAQVAGLADPVGEVISEAARPNGMVLQRVRIPVGVIGIIYESRPNVTADAAALCVRSGNAAILRGGSEAVHSNRAIHKALVAGLAEGGVPAEAVQLVPTQDRAAVGAMLGAAGLIDMIVPRGGKSLVARVQADARVPVLAHLDGINHTFVHASADPAMAQAIVLNAKMRRTGVCGAMETLLIDATYPDPHGLVEPLLDAGCELRGDARARAIDPRIAPAADNDWDTEYLEAILSVAVVDGLDEALAHIARHASGHTDAIVAADQDVADRFLAEVDSAIVMHNASSQFADGGEFGLGAEIGIATGRLHARGPVALEGLTTYKWLVRGSGQTRP
ncbi:glutamate-5-semialdehyde dehydrogenase [Novosphingobium aromaticivorans DSM 12444]|uniref:Gamma-glutamyl phosphate reductase n=1 Tax=Novosphingobium aromaticivorans (strain ATCC 700278 / DSM 12444 / CCUG 56034 / CIP 105152 / NBRC 16084 / F199) TaxID=279238 RepID=PROA_NOVAD|nr:glutamate-5-semialdehyde dehydrogenase [Novosphingobium aromaticivorans]Q2GCB4.1 RecName: Full=Gamma-glutamyl phosphate reductase; Short=GPR; AltName: Full=Glutamate-5-semialdehyde dehydrogenase; AltName: Full=Glutamyl-gamma-semialdehyde dehydrogenase; Short=GSA dehydrogenase [Novosphingobium aromaticivorans DSM 12444]ABD24509.1 glutamate-5-semialdehyde dehydrogenase [Novosphingobium aromaticivorans DSM 12444]SCY26140.1 glutamate-5-semialdehyde dehydrogenase [Novosphingobium aromaticivorans]